MKTSASSIPTLDELERIATRTQPYKAQWTADFDAMKRALPDLIKAARERAVLKAEVAHLKQQVEFLAHQRSRAEEAYRALTGVCP